MENVEAGLEGQPWKNEDSKSSSKDFRWEWEWI
jgi:hypothetical protein